MPPHRKVFKITGITRAQHDGPTPATEPGADLTVLRLPGAGQAEKARALASEDDHSVADGLLAVTVRPWRMLLRA
jgi:hypothetical protein